MQKRSQLDLKSANDPNVDQDASKIQWREEFYRLHTSEKAASRAAAFRRALDALVKGGSVIAHHDGLYSLP